MNKDKMWSLFVFDDSRFGKQAIDDTGKVIYYEMKEKLTKEYIDKHLSGQVTLSVFPVLKDRTKWFCIDIDINKKVYSAESFKLEEYLPKLEELADKIKGTLDALGIKAYKEYTGGKGMHVWIFFDPPVLVHQVLRTLVPIIKGFEYDKEIFNVEYFPNSLSSKSVKLPGGKNSRYEDSWSRFETTLDQVEPVSPKLLFDMSNPLENVYTKCLALKNLKDKADIEKHLTHNERKAIGTLLYDLEEKFVDYTENYYFKDLDNYNPEITRKNLISLAKSSKPIKCATLQEQGICPGQCDAIKSGAKSPIQFYWDEMNEGKQQKIEDLPTFNPQDNLIKIKNNFYEKNRNNELVLLSNYAIDIDYLEEIEEGDESDTTITQMFSGKLITHKGEEYEFSIPLDKYYKDEHLIAEIYKVLRMGGASFVEPKKISKIRQCIDKFSSPVSIKKTRNFGFNKDYTAYYTPSMKIDKDGIYPNTDIKVEVSPNKGELEQNLDFAPDHPDRGEEYWKNFWRTDVNGLYKNPGLAMSALAFTMDIFLKPAYGALENDNPYILWLTGETGVGKSRMLMLAQRMFGPFPKTYSFTSTPARIEYSGFYYKDAIYSVDDFKLSSTPTETAKQQLISIIQNYTDRTGRSRLTRDIAARRSYWIRGNLMVNGEDILQQEPSSIARMTILPFRKTDVVYDFELYNKIQEISMYLNEWTPHIIHWVMNQDKEEIKSTRLKWLTHYHKIAEGKPNEARLSSNFSKYTTGLEYAVKYLYEGRPEYEQIKEAVFQFMEFAFMSMVNLVEEENYASRFWNTLMEMISTNLLRIVKDGFVTDEDKTKIVGFIKDGSIFVIHQLAVKEITGFLRSVAPLNVSAKALSDNLYANGFYTTPSNVKKYFNGKQVRVFQVNTAKQAELIKEGLK